MLFAPIKLLSISAAVNQYTSVIVEPNKQKREEKEDMSLGFVIKTLNLEIRKRESFQKFSVKTDIDAHE